MLLWKSFGFGEEMTVGDILHLLKKKKKLPDSQGWYQLKWQSIKNGTWNLYKTQNYYMRRVGFEIGLGRNQGQYGRINKEFSMCLILIWVNFHFWLDWKIEATDDAIKESKNMARQYRRFPIK